MSNSTTILGVEHRARSQLPRTSDPWWRGVLGVAQFGLDPAPLDLGNIPVATVPLARFGDIDALCEIWRAAGEMRVGTFGRVHYRFNADLLFGAIEVPEPEQDEATESPLRANTMAAYGNIFAALEATGYRHLVRVWNYLSDITRPAKDGERYWVFNKARYEAFLACEHSIVEAPPAASALGTPGGSALVIYFLANRTPAQMLENPRQVSAYCYPAQYGPRSPTFSRAALLGEGAGTLMISGTASIVGHQTLHSGDAPAQVRESLANILALTGNANRRLPSQRFHLDSLTYKVYVRHAADLHAIKAVVQEVIGENAPVAYLRADICRRDLLVEIEAVGCGAWLSYEIDRGRRFCTVA